MRILTYPSYGLYVFVNTKRGTKEKQIPAAKEMFFVTAFMMTNKGTNKRLTKGKTAKETPAAVEAPLPPLKLAKIGQLWPHIVDPAIPKNHPP